MSVENKKTFLDKNYMFITSLRGKTPIEIIKDIESAEKNGTDGFIFHFQLLDKEYRNETSLKQIIESATKPFMTLNYDVSGEEKNHDEKARLLLKSLDYGATAVDMPIYLYDENPEDSLINCNREFVKCNPKEITMNEVAIRKQKEFIEKVHQKGGEVLVSCHTWVEMSCEEVLDLALEIKSRGADIVKIISTCNSSTQMLEVLKTIDVLKKTLNNKFLYQCAGPYGRFVRYVAPMFGSCMALCHNQYGEKSNREKPLLENVKKVFDIISWRNN